MSSDILADPSSPLNSWASCEPWVGCHCNYIVTQKWSANKICKSERERERIHTEGRVGGEGSGANCAHDSMRAGERGSQPASKRGLCSLYRLCFIQKKKGGSQNSVPHHFYMKPISTDRAFDYDRQEGNGASVTMEKVEWAEESDRVKHCWISAVYMVEEMEFIHLYYLARYN